jgi:hypothetical protein
MELDFALGVFQRQIENFYQSLLWKCCDHKHSSSQNRQLVLDTSDSSSQIRNHCN